MLAELTLSGMSRLVWGDGGVFLCHHLVLLKAQHLLLHRQQQSLGVLSLVPHVIKYYIELVFLFHGSSYLIEGARSCLDRCRPYSKGNLNKYMCLKWYQESTPF